MKKQIICFGDSNTHGYDSARNGDRYDETIRWTALLQKKLGEEYNIVEEGLSGRTTCFEDPLDEGMSALPYMKPCLMSHKPVDLLVIMLGTNDTKERFGASAHNIAEGLTRLVRKAMDVKECWRDGKPNILIVVPKNIGEKYVETECFGHMGRECAEKSELLAAEYKQVAELLGCHFMDANEVVIGGMTEIDYMHLNVDGHRQMAEAMAVKIPECCR